MPGDAVGRAVLRALARAARRLDRGLPGAKALLRPFDGPGAPLSTAEGARKGPLWRAVRRALRPGPPREGRARWARGSHGSPPLPGTSWRPRDSSS